MAVSIRPAAAKSCILLRVAQTSSRVVLIGGRSVVQGINRLGKGPPKPGSYRPPDPNKYRTMDMYSEGAEGDADYMRMVQDVSKASHTLLE